MHWSGTVSAREIKSMLGQADQFEIQLAPEYNHVLYSRLHSAKAQAGSENIDKTGGVELLEKIADIQGLEALAELVAPLSRAGASVHIESPPWIIIELPH